MSLDSEITFSPNTNVNLGKLSLTGEADLSLGSEDITLAIADPVSVGNSQKLQN